MAESWPEDLYPQRATWGIVHNSRAFTSTLSNAQQIVGYPGAYWRCSLQFSNMSRDKERKLTALIGRLRGMAGTVNVPAETRMRNDDLGAPVVAQASANTYAITVDGLGGHPLEYPPGPSLDLDFGQQAYAVMQRLAFHAGDYITISGQLYEVVEDVVMTGATAVVPVNRRIRSTIAPGTPIEYRNPYCEMRLSSDAFSVDLQPVVGHSSIDLREAF